MLVTNSNPPLDATQHSVNAGARICNATKTLVATTVALYTLCERTANSPGRVATMVLTGAAGLQKIYSGDVIEGGLYAGLAVKEFMNIFGTNNNNSEVVRLISDARANVEMIETLEESNKKSLDVIEHNLDLVSNGMNTLTTQLEEIQNLATLGSEELEIQKNNTCKLYSEADQLFSQAHAKILESQANISTAHGQFKSALEKFDDLIDLAQSTEGDLKKRLDALVNTSKSIHAECLKATDMLDNSDPLLAEGLKLYDAAIAKKDAAQFEAGRAVEMAKQNNLKLAEKAVVVDDGKNNIAIIESELDHVKERNELIQNLLQDQATNLLQAHELAEASWGTMSTLIGGGLGALAMGAVGAAVGPGGGVTGTIAGVGMGAKAFHERNKIAEFVMGADVVPVPDKPTTDNTVTFKFNEKSSGFWGRYYYQRPSTTVGQVSINLGNNESVSYAFNLNDVQNARSPISQKDLVDLGERLAKNLKEGSLTGEQCKKILKQLQTIPIDRSQNGNGMSYGFLRGTTAAARFLTNITQQSK